MPQTGASISIRSILCIGKKTALGSTGSSCRTIRRVSSKDDRSIPRTPTPVAESEISTPQNFSRGLLSEISTIAPGSNRSLKYDPFSSRFCIPAHLPSASNDNPATLPAALCCVLRYAATNRQITSNSQALQQFICACPKPDCESRLGTGTIGSWRFVNAKLNSIKPNSIT